MAPGGHVSGSRGVRPGPLSMGRTSTGTTRDQAKGQDEGRGQGKVRVKVTGILGPLWIPLSAGEQGGSDCSPGQPSPKWDSTWELGAWLRGIPLSQGWFCSRGDTGPLPPRTCVWAAGQSQAWAPYVGLHTGSHTPGPAWPGLAAPPHSWRPSHTNAGGATCLPEVNFSFNRKLF